MREMGNNSMRHNSTLGSIVFAECWLFSCLAVQLWLPPTLAGNGLPQLNALRQLQHPTRTHSPSLHSLMSPPHRTGHSSVSLGTSLTSAFRAGQQLAESLWSILRFNSRPTKQFSSLSH
jgi:hypothetical protein